jgi:hypothetical protein
LAAVRRGRCEPGVFAARGDFAKHCAGRELSVVSRKWWKFSGGVLRAV